jgi:predicted RNase H-like HicB family nuclease
MKYKSLDYYLNLPWTYTVEHVWDEKQNWLYVVRVNELPGICTDAASYDEAVMLIKEPMLVAFEFYIENNEAIPRPIAKEEDFI